MTAPSAVSWFPAGTIIAFVGTTPPEGWLWCDGRPVSRLRFAALFHAIATRFGAGDGRTTFNVPDLRGRFLLGVDVTEGPRAGRVAGDAAAQVGGVGGAESHTLTTAELAPHTHDYTRTRGVVGEELDVTIGFETSRVERLELHPENVPSFPTGQGVPHNNMPPYLAVQYLISIGASSAGPAVTND